MNKRMMGLALMIAAFAMSAAAQTVTSSGTTGTVGNIPYVSAASSTSTTLGSSPITVSGGNVGIGTTSPPAALTLGPYGNSTTHNVFLSQSWDTTTGFANFVGSWNSGGWWGIGALDSGNDYKLRIGNVGSGLQGSGTWAPQQNLNLIVGGVITPSAGVVYPDGNTQTVAYTASAAAVNNLLSSSDGEIGIGTSAPESILDLELPNNTAESILTFGNIEQGRYGWIGISNGPGEPLQVMGATGDDLVLGASNTERVRILNTNGNVGIGTTTPGAKLEVNGGLRFTGDAAGTVQTTAWTGVLCGGDYAEAVDAKGSRKAYGPGDVLVIGDGTDGEVQRSAAPYSTMVAGIFATKPGVIGRRQSLVKDAEEIPMAMVGIVPTKVTAENGPIHRGDLLVTSSATGYAMKGTDRERMLGAVIGKAMGNLDSGTGVIEVLVTLQ